MKSAWLLVPLLWIAGDDPGCDMGSSLTRATDDMAVLLVVATGETSLVPVPDEPAFAHASASEVVAHGFEVLVEEGAEGRIGRGDRLYVVPWAYGAGCELIEWEEEGWVPSGEEAVFFQRVQDLGRADDVILHKLGWHSPYPHGEFLARGAGADEDRDEWLSARDFFSLVVTLPVSDPTRPRAERLAAIERVFDDGPSSWAERYPGSEILRRARVWSAQPGR